MRRFANLFLILFLADGLVSLADELLVLFAGTTPLSGVRSLFAWPVIITSLPLYVCLGVDRRLPEWIFLPQLGLIFWSIFDLWPLPVIYDRSGYMLPVALIQVLFGLAPLMVLKKKYGRGWLLPGEMFSAPLFRWRHTVLFFVANVLILPVVLVYATLSLASLQLYDQSGGFARLWPNGLLMSERIYRKAGKDIRLTSMIHIADKAYFEDVLQSISSDRTIVLAEGVSDKENLLTYRFSYGELARDLGLTSQEKMVFTGKLIKPEEVQGASEMDWDTESGYHILRADIDAKEFHPKTIEFLNLMGEHILSGHSMAEGIRTYIAWVKANSHELTSDTIMQDILNRRNQEVIRHMNRVLDHYDTVIIPWGALHMPEIEAAVLGNGFKLTKSHLRISIDFKKMVFEAI